MSSRRNALGNSPNRVAQRLLTRLAKRRYRKAPETHYFYNALPSAKRLGISLK
jgi:hypothetical protein